MLLAITTNTGALKREYIYLEGLKVASLIDDDYAGEDLEVGPEGNNVVVGTDSAETLNGTSADDTVIALADNDTLTGSDGDDVLASGAGNDAMAGDAGDDTYRWGRGDGNDSIDDSNSADATDPSHVDRIVFGYGIAEADLSWQRQGDHLLFTLTDTGETLQIDDYYQAVTRRVEAFELADGTALDSALWDSL